MRDFSMRAPLSASLALAATLFAAGCATLQPAVPAAAPAIPAEWPLPADTLAEGNTADIGWREFFVDPRLESVVELALENNRDLRIAILNVERARAQYRIRRADRLPSFGAEAGMERSGGDIPVSETYTAGVGLAAFELDLFGRVHNLSAAALQAWLAQEDTRRSAQLVLVSEVANAWLTLAADQQLLRLSQDTLAAHGESLALVEKRHEVGAASALDVSRQRTQAESARVEVARQQGLVARDTNALRLLAGTELDPGLLPSDGVPATAATGLPALPAGLPSEVLLRRPDVLAAEHTLLAANANIGAARAAFFPSISLTGSIGSASDEFSGLFDGGNTVWSFVPRINIPIFQGGRLRAGLAVATADRDIALARYEQAIQAGFREVADALALTVTLAEQRAAQEALVSAAAAADTLAAARYRAGADGQLAVLDAQRTLYAARSGLVAVQLAEQANRATLYRVLGGGWTEQTE